MKNTAKIAALLALLVGIGAGCIKLARAAVGYIARTEYGMKYNPIARGSKPDNCRTGDYCDYTDTTGAATRWSNTTDATHVLVSPSPSPGFDGQCVKYDSTKVGGFTNGACSGGGAVGYQTVLENASSLTQRTVVNFSSRFNCTDNSGAARTDCELATSGATAASYTNMNATVDVYGRVTAASNGTSGLPSQTSNNKRLLTTDGSNASWQNGTDILIQDDAQTALSIGTTKGVTLSNTTAATALSTKQMAPPVVFSGQTWDSNDLSSKTNKWAIGPSPSPAPSSGRSVLNFVSNMSGGGDALAATLTPGDPGNASKATGEMTSGAFVTVNGVFDCGGEASVITCLIQGHRQNVEMVANTGTDVGGFGQVKILAGDNHVEFIMPPTNAGTDTPLDVSRQQFIWLSFASGTLGGDVFQINTNSAVASGGYSLLDVENAGQPRFRVWPAALLAASVYGIIFDSSANQFEVVDSGESSSQHGAAISLDATQFGVGGVKWRLLNWKENFTGLGANQLYLIRDGIGGLMISGNTGEVGTLRPQNSTTANIGTTDAKFQDGWFSRQLNTQALTTGAFALTDAATINTDASKANLFTVTLAGNRTLANPTNMVNGTTYRWLITQDGTGSRTLAYGANFAWPAGTAPTLSTGINKVDKIDCTYDGTKLRCISALDIR